MKLTAFVNGHKVGVLEYDLPRDEHGKTIPLPAKGHHPGDVSVEIESDGGDHRWFGIADLLDISK